MIGDNLRKLSDKTEGKKRPLRNRIEDGIDKVSEGPLGYAGKGNLIGGVSYFTASFINKFNPVAGANIGYRVFSHSVEKTDTEEIHTFYIDSWLKDTSRFASKFKAPPSIVDFFRENTEVLSVEPYTERRTSTTWKIKVSVKPRRNIKD